MYLGTASFSSGGQNSLSACKNNLKFTSSFKYLVPSSAYSMFVFYLFIYLFILLAEKESERKRKKNLLLLFPEHQGEALSIRHKGHHYWIQTVSPSVKYFHKTPHVKNSVSIF